MAATVWLVLRFTWKRDSLQMLDGYDYRYLGLGIGLLAVSLLADGLRITLTTRALGIPLAFRSGLRSVLVGHFVAAITPFLAGGAPLQVYSLYRAGVPSGVATALVLGSGLIAQILLVIASVALLFWPSSPLVGEHLGIGLHVIRWMILIYTAGLSVFFLLIWHAEAGGRRLVVGIARMLRGRAWFKQERIDGMAEGLLQFLKELNHAFRDLVARRPLAAIAGTAGYLLYFALFFSIAPALLGGLQTSLSYAEAISLQIPVYLLASIVPTPGASGGLEAGMTLIFAERVPEAALGLFVAGWRVLTYYGHVLAGGIACAILVRGVTSAPPLSLAASRPLTPQTYDRN